MLFTLCLSSAFAAPDRAVALAETTTAVEDVVATQDDAWVAFTTTAGEVVVMDTGTWTPYSATLSAGTATGGVAVGGDVDNPMLFAGLSNKTVQIWSLIAGSTPNSTATIVVPGDPLALAADSTTLYVLYEDPANGPSLQAYDLNSGNYPAKYVTAADLPEDGFTDMDARVSTDDTGMVSVTYLYVAHGGSQLTRVTVGSESASTVRDSTSEGSFDIEDVWAEDGGSSTWFANSGGNTSYGYLTSDSATIDIESPSSPDVGSTTAVGGSGEDGWLALATASTLYVYSYGGGVSIGEEVGQIPEGANATDIVSVTGYGFVGTAEGLVVITDRPWVEVTEVSSTSVSPDEEFTITFSSDTAGTWKVNRQVAGMGQVPENVDGASGSIEAGETKTATISLPAVDDSDTRYLVEAQVTPSGSTDFGRDGAYIYVNAPPPTPEIDADTVAFGDQRIHIRFDAFDPESAQSYPIWVSTVEWTAEEYPTEGPVYEGPDDWPEEGLIAYAENGVVDCIIDGVENGTTYYVAAQSVDTSEDGTTTEKSAMSDVYAVTPEETFSVSERLGLESWCGLPLTSAGWFGSLAAAAVALRRRRPSARAVSTGGRAAGTAVGFGVMVLVLVAPAAAQAAPKEDNLTSRNGDFELRYGPFLTQDSAALTDAFGSTDNRLLRGQVGYTQNLFQIDLGFGLYSDSGGQATASGTTSGDTDELLAFPLALEGTLRLDFFPEQPVVPFGRAGADLWVWNETWTSANDSSGGGETTAGTFGWHWAAGAFILLDPLDEGSASRLETIASINDTYLVVQYQQTYSLGDEKLDFTSTELTFGLKFDY